MKWTAAFLTGRLQQVKIGNISDPFALNGNFPQGPEVGQMFHILQNKGLYSSMRDIYKYVDDTSVVNIRNNPFSVDMQVTADKISRWYK